jgi:hypothetical protein
MEEEMIKGGEVRPEGGICEPGSDILELSAIAGMRETNIKVCYN